MEKDIKEFYKKNKSLTKTANHFDTNRHQVKKILGIENVKIKKICVECGENFETKYNTQSTCSKQCRKEYKKKYLKSRNYEYNKVVKWRNDKKIKSVEYKGGKCVICGYKKCYSALEFHHNDPNEKDFTISKYPNRSFDRIKKELDKCVLVCSNCHREIHEGLIT